MKTGHSDREVNLNRRKAFTQFLGSLLVSADEIRGHKNCAFGDLENLGRAKFEKLIPAINKEYELSVLKGRLVGRNRNTKEKIELFELGAENTTAFNLINGKNNVGKIADAFSVEMHQGGNESFEYVKKILFDLLRLQVCVFLNTVED